MLKIIELNSKSSCVEFFVHFIKMSDADEMLDSTFKTFQYILAAKAAL